MKPLNTRLLNQFLNLACERLSGEWLLIGGTLLPAVGIYFRPTIDIELVGLGEKEAAQTLELMDLAQSLDLPIESINQAASFFVKKIGVDKKDLITLKKGKRAVIYRPSVILYWKLKLPRLTESDVLDCEHYLAYCKGQADKFNQASLKKEVERQLEAGGTPERIARLKRLQNLLDRD